MLEMAKMNDLNIDRYLKVLLKYWSTTDEQLAELAPWSEKLWSIKNRRDCEKKSVNKILL